MITAEEARKLAEKAPNCKDDIAERIKNAAKLGEFQLFITKTETDKILSEYKAVGYNLLWEYFMSFGYKVINVEGEVVIKW
jgi:hypothetical protein